MPSLNHIDFDMVLIKGTDYYQMGNDVKEPCERPRMEVCIPDFRISNIPISIGLWNMYAIEANKVIRQGPPNLSMMHVPITNITWQEALEYCLYLSGKNDKGYRLPTEAEWEYAASCGRGNHYYSWGTTKYIYENHRAQYDYTKYSLPNDWGLYRMGGCVWEWCLDNWTDNLSSYPREGPNIPNQVHTIDKVVKGGCFASNSREIRTGSRNGMSKKDRSSLVGFRVVCHD
jgi:formylglycine-generating enzyme required for sulfatase activity